jgi:hypothetical protein
MTGHNQLQKSASRLQRQGSVWLDQTWQAGEVFFAESRSAGQAFARDLWAASDQLAKSIGQATRGLQKAVHKEALDWRQLVLKTREGYIESWKAQLGRLEDQASTTREALKPEAVEATVLESTRDLLERAQHKVDARLEQAHKPVKKAKATRSTRKKVTKAKSSKAASKKTAAPIRDYDQLTAKDVATRVHKLSGREAAAVLDYEKARKKRATVIRAAEQRLAAAS